MDGTAKNDDLFKVEKSTELVVCTLGAGGETIGIAAIAMVSQVAIIVLRILNVCEKKKKVFLVVVRRLCKTDVPIPSVLNT